MSVNKWIGPGNITRVVSAEKAVHNALRETAQAAWDKHGVCVKSVCFSLVDVSTQLKSNMIVTEVDAATMTKE